MISIKKDPEKVLILNKGGKIIKKETKPENIPIVISNMQYTLRLY